MKKLLLLVFVFCAMFFPDESHGALTTIDPIRPQKLVGVWRHRDASSERILTFSSDHTFTKVCKIPVNNGSDGDGIWTLTTKNITIKWKHLEGRPDILGKPLVSAIYLKGDFLQVFNNFYKRVK